jgi:hypothetical protein
VGVVPPNQPKTPVRTVRVPDDIWQALRARADERGETVTDVVLRALRRYLGEYDPP